MNENGEPDRLLKTDEVAAKLRCHAETVRRMARNGRLPSIKAGKNLRFPESVLDQMIYARRPA